MWLPGHQNIGRSTEVDMLAKLTTKNTNTDIKKITSDDLQNYIKTNILQEWQHDWLLTDNKLRQIKTTVKTWSDKFEVFTRRDEVVLTRLRIGHSFLTHGYLFQKKRMPNCNVCNAPLTIKHILTDCKRRDHLKIPHDLHDLLTEGSPHIPIILQHLHDINIYSQI